MINTDRLHAIIKNSLFREEEIVDRNPPENAVIVEGIVNTYAFHPQRLLSCLDEVTEMLEQLPLEFFPSSEGGGGGWSFLNLVCLRGGEDEFWTGYQRRAEELACLAIGLGLAEWTPRQREIWSAFPGGVPYFTIKEKVKA